MPVNILYVVATMGEKKLIYFSEKGCNCYVAVVVELYELKSYSGLC